MAICQLTSPNMWSPGTVSVCIMFMLRCIIVVTPHIICCTTIMAQGIAVLLVLQIIVILVASPARSEASPDSCVECSLMSLVPPKWKKDGTDIRSLPLLCNVTKSACSIDFYKDFISFSKSAAARCDPKTYCDVDVYLRCPTHDYSIGMSSLNFF